MEIEIEITADDEMPDCLNCIHVCSDFNCEKWCGPEHGWWGYQRIPSTINEKVIK